METQNNEGIKEAVSNFSHLENAAIQDINNRYNKRIDQLETEEGLNLVLSHENKKYKNNPKEKLIKFLNKKRNEQIEGIKTKIKEVASSEDLIDGQLIITLEWTASRTWGATVKSYTNYGFVSGCVSGCGYDKESTATAQALNSRNNILKLLYNKKNEYLKNATDQEIKDNHAILGYGSGYNMLPSFEGGVGVSSHQHIFKDLGYSMACISSGKMSSVYVISKQKEAV